MSRPFIVKVQISVATTEDERQVLIYNQDQSLWLQFDLTPQIKEVTGGALKSFFMACINEDTQQLEILSKVDEKNWPHW